MSLQRIHLLSSGSTPIHSKYCKVCNSMQIQMITIKHAPVKIGETSFRGGEQAHYAMRNLIVNSIYVIIIFIPSATADTF